MSRLSLPSEAEEVVAEEEDVDVVEAELVPLQRGSATGVESQDIIRIIVLTKAHLWRMQNAFSVRRKDI